MDRLGLLGTALVLSATMVAGGCELVVDFDRSKIPDGDVVEGGTDGAMDAGPMMDGGEDAGRDAAEDAPADAPMDAPADAPMDAPADAPMDAPADGDTDASTDAGTDAPSCGNGLVEGSEECDDDNTDTGDGCADDCTIEDGWVCDAAEPSGCSEVCGDGMTVGDEACDDGFTDACGSCNADCTGAGSGSTCGDGDVCPETESCDDGFTDACGSCNADCSGSGGGSTCGDGEICPETETCDDGNTDACGTCSADCSTEQLASAATGSITTVAVSSLADGETFTLDDGVNAATIFEFDTDASIGGDVAVDISSISTADEVRDAIVGAVDGVGAGLLITASDGGAATVDLVNDEVGVQGNVAITESVSDSGFTVDGMSGGTGADCTSGTGCTSDADCTSTCGTSTAGECD